MQPVLNPRAMPVHHLHFPKSQARVLAATAQRLKSAGAAREDVELFERAAKATKLREPLPVRGTPDEVEQVAEGFARAGVRRPKEGASGG